MKDFLPLFMLDLWDALSPFMQDSLLFALYLMPCIMVGLYVSHGFRPLPLVRAMLWQFRWTSLMFIALIATSVALGVGLLAQERGLRQGTAKAAEKFDLIIAAPGSEVTNVLAAVYLQPTDLSLLDGKLYNEIANHDHVSFAAPIAFGDSYQGAPVVGTTLDFLQHLSGELRKGRAFEKPFEAVVGSAIDLPLGSHFTPAHGTGHSAEADAHEGEVFRIVGRMQPTGSPWDKAILVPVEAVWLVHGMGTGHKPQEGARLGPPFDPDYFPGTPAILVRAEELWANYALKSEFTRKESMAIFPGAVLSQLHAILGDIRSVMSIMAVITQILVAGGVLTGLVILTRLFSRRLALLRAIGAPRRFVFSIVWSFAAILIGAGAVSGLGFGFVTTALLSNIISERTDILIKASLQWPEFHLLAGFVSITILLAMIPAGLALLRPAIRDLRA
ncbi:MAG: FtsX-like permease family protein [Cohaesibacter sp.]|nr:FtsX-like permease family protein [Cohaesibacter sp.]